MTVVTGPFTADFPAPVAPVRVLEVTALHALPDEARRAWSSVPGAVARDASGDPVLLHYAPGRWLVSGTGPVVEAALAHIPSFGTAADVTGKWLGLHLAGEPARRLLASTVAIEAVLRNRECAALLLFDCPCVIARTSTGHVAWLQASYRAHFLAVAATI